MNETRWRSIQMILIAIAFGSLGVDAHFQRQDIRALKSKLAALERPVALPVRSVSAVQSEETILTIPVRTSSDRSHVQGD